MLIPSRREYNFRRTTGSKTLSSRNKVYIEILLQVIYLSLKLQRRYISFLGIANKYGLGRLAFIVNNTVGNKIIVWTVYRIDIEDMHLQNQGYFGLQGIINLNQCLTDTLKTSDLIKLEDSDAKKIMIFHERVFKEINAKSFEVLIKKTSLKNHRVHQE